MALNAMAIGVSVTVVFNALSCSAAECPPKSLFLNLQPWVFNLQEADTVRKVAVAQNYLHDARFRFDTPGINQLPSNPATTIDQIISTGLWNEPGVVYFFTHGHPTIITLEAHHKWTSVASLFTRAANIESALSAAPGSISISRSDEDSSLALCINFATGICSMFSTSGKRLDGTLMIVAACATVCPQAPCPADAWHSCAGVKEYYGYVNDVLVTVAKGETILSFSALNGCYNFQPDKVKEYRNTDLAFDLTTMERLPAGPPSGDMVLSPTIIGSNVVDVTRDLVHIKTGGTFLNRMDYIFDAKMETSVIPTISITPPFFVDTFSTNWTDDHTLEFFLNGDDAAPGQFGVLTVDAQTSHPSDVNDLYLAAMELVLRGTILRWL